MPRADRRDATTLLRRLARDTRGVELVELVMVLPLLLIVVFGILEFGSVFDKQHVVSTLSREGANIASRGAALDSVVSVTISNGNTVDVGPAGAVIASRVDVVGGVPQVAAQSLGGSMTATSKVGTPGNPATPYVGNGLADGNSYYVVEIFLPYQPFTPLRGLVAPVIPDTLYDRTIF
ncbi:MAG: pilus assembly protein [Gemmatimonadetes bacterium]|nr:pilus assembly protein [Gemmatimonadota bacterium]